MNVDAYHLYLRGRFYCDQYSEESTNRALDCFRQAIAKDPRYAPAYAGLADCYTMLGGQAWPPKEAFPDAKKALKQALELDDQLAEVHVSLGWILLCYEREWLTAGREFEQALKLNPHLPDAHKGYGWYCALSGRLEEGIAELERSKALDPLSPVLSSELALIYFWSGKRDRAHAEIRHTLEIDPSFFFGYQLVGLFAGVEGRYLEAIQALERALNLAKENPDATATLGFVHASAGNQVEA